VVDLYIILFFLAAMLVAVFRGVISELFDLLTCSLGLIFTLSVFEIPGRALIREMRDSPATAYIISFLLIFIPVGLLFASLGLRFSKYVKERIPSAAYYGAGIPVSIVKSAVVVSSLLLLLWSGNISPSLKEDLHRSLIAERLSSYNTIILGIVNTAAPPDIASKVRRAIEQQEMYKKERSTINSFHFIPAGGSYETHCHHYNAGSDSLLSMRSSDQFGRVYIIQCRNGNAHLQGDRDNGEGK